jgi:DNA/RNA-binding domain of Phe-tRNA-synthetase-like protein
MIQIEIDQTVSNLAIGVVEAGGLTIGPPGDDLREYCADAARQVAANGSAGGETRRQAIRALLRAGGFKPAGRNKPAQEYLYRTIDTEGELPAILNAVDVLNAVSLLSGLPISVVSADRLGPRATTRYGQEGERYVFNRTGQELDLRGLICICSDDGDKSLPLGSPVKDSMPGKISEEDQHVVACIYAPRQNMTAQELMQWADELAAGFVRWCGAQNCQSWTIPESW